MNPSPHPQNEIGVYTGAFKYRHFYMNLTIEILAWKVFFFLFFVCKVKLLNGFFFFIWLNFFVNT